MTIDGDVKPRDVSTLAQVRERYLSLQDMANDLARFQEFEGVSASTVSRWLSAEKDPNQKGLPPRAQRAIWRLASPKPEGVLRVSYPIAPFALPIMLLTAFLQRNTLPPGLQKVNIESVDTPTGHEAIKMLIKNEADVALSYHFFHDESAASTCLRLTSFCRYYVSGLGREDKKIINRRELPNIRFGYDVNSGVGIYLRNCIPFPSFGDYEPKYFNDALHAVQMLADRKIDFVLASQPTLTKIRKEMDILHPDKPLRSFPSSLLPPADFDIFLNKRTVNANAVFILLNNLFRIIDNLEDFLSSLPTDQKLALAKTLGFMTYEEMVSMVLSSEDNRTKDGSAYDFCLERFVDLRAILEVGRSIKSF